MKIFAMIAVIAVIFAGCGTTKKLPEIRSEYREIEKVDTHYVKMPADTQYISVPIDCPDDSIIFVEGKTKTEVVIRDKILTVKRLTKADSVAVYNIYKEKYGNTETVKTVEVEKVVNKIPKFYYYLLAIFIILTIFAYRKPLLKIIKSILRFPV